MTTTIGERRKPDERLRYLTDQRTLRFQWLGERVENDQRFFQLAVSHDTDRKAYVVRCSTGTREYRRLDGAEQEHYFDTTKYGMLHSGGRDGDDLNGTLLVEPTPRFNKARYIAFALAQRDKLLAGGYDEHLTAEVLALLAVRP